MGFNSGFKGLISAVVVKVVEWCSIADNFWEPLSLLYKEYRGQGAQMQHR